MILHDTILASLKILHSQNDNHAIAKSQANIVISECMKHAAPGVFDAFKAEDIGRVLSELKALSESIPEADALAILERAGLRQKKVAD